MAADAAVSAAALAAACATAAAPAAANAASVALLDVDLAIAARDVAASSSPCAAAVTIAAADGATVAEKREGEGNIDVIRIYCNQRFGTSTVSSASFPEISQSTEHRLQDKTSVQLTQHYPDHPKHVIFY